jgi:CheY-like chemotaxis protein/anti-sigma regulatory factor (Ser/Thr protein kinase)
VREGEKERAVIERQVAHLARLVDDLLDVSRIARGKVALDLEPAELSDVVAKAIEVATPLLEQRRHRLEVSVSEAGLPLLADRSRLAQVVANLLVNAAKYTDPGGRVELVAWRDGEHVRLEVRDDGIGIAPDLLPRIFDLFFQQPQGVDRASGGLGLGLAIARSLTSLHGGALSARSDGPGRGSTFELRLPAAAPASRAVVGPRVAAFEDAAAPGLASARVLVVDDNPDAAATLAEALSAQGHDVRLAVDGPSALDLTAEFVPDVALLDLGLPVMDGLELARALKQRPGVEGVRLVAVTGYVRARDQQQTRAAGFDAHLVKPYEVSRLDALIRRLAGRGPQVGGEGLAGAAATAS